VILAEHLDQGLQCGGGAGREVGETLSAGDHLTSLSVGRLKGGAVVKAIALRSHSALVVLLDLPEHFLCVCVEVAGENLAEHADE
jgi:hypothetical protein